MLVDVATAPRVVHGVDGTALSPWTLIFRKNGISTFIDTFPESHTSILLTAFGAGSVSLAVGSLFYFHLFLGKHRDTCCLIRV